MTFSMVMDLFSKLGYGSGFHFLAKQTTGSSICICSLNFGGNTKFVFTKKKIFRGSYQSRLENN
jgi:hypothetical protein